MAKPTRDPEIQRKIREWIEKNPERIYTAKYKDIEIEADVSRSSLYRYFPLIAARVVNRLPSEIIEQRRADGGMGNWRAKLSDAEIAEIQQLFNEGKTPLDISFMTGHSLSRIEQHRPKKEEND